MTARLFTDYLRELDKGRVIEELSTGMQELISCIMETGKRGSLTLKIDIAPSSKIDTETVAVVASLKITSPEPDRHSTLYYITPENNLSRRDPRQMDLEDALTVHTGGQQAEGA